MPDMSATAVVGLLVGILAGFVITLAGMPFLFRFMNWWWNKWYR